MAAETSAAPPKAARPTKATTPVKATGTANAAGAAKAGKPAAPARSPKAPAIAPAAPGARAPKGGNPVSAPVRVRGKVIGSHVRSATARNQARRDSR